MSMKRDAMELLLQVGAKQNKPELVPVPNSNKQRVFHNGVELSPILADPPLRKFKADSLESFVDAMQQFAESGPTVFHNRNEIVGLLDSDDRREYVNLSLSAHEQFKSLVNVKPMSPPELVRWLKVSMYEAVPSEFYLAFTKIDFKRRNDGSFDTVKNRESLGRQVEAEVVGTNDLPDEINVHIPVYAEHGCRMRYNVKVFIIPDPQNERFLVVLPPGAIEQVIDEAQATLQDALYEGLGRGQQESAGDGETVRQTTVIYGSPNL